MAWNYKHNTTLPNTTIVNAPDNTLRGNVCYIDAVNGYVNQAAVTAINPAAEVGSADYPYKSFTGYKADIGTHAIYVSIIAKGVYSDENLGLIQAYSVIGDERYTAVFQGSGSNPFCERCGTISGAVTLAALTQTKGFWNVVIKGHTDLATGTESSFTDCILETPENSAHGSGVHERCIYIGTHNLRTNGVSRYNLYYNNTIGIAIKTPNLNGLNIYYNCTVSATSGAQLDTIDFLNNFYYGSLFNGTSSYDISAAIAASKSEATIQSEISALFSITWTSSHKEVNFINASKGTFNLDYINYSGNVTALLALSSYKNVCKRGIKYEWDTTEANSDFIFSATSPHYSALDGFGGLTCHNLNADGSIINTAVDAAAVGKIVTLSSVAVIDFINQFGKFGAGTFDFDEMYVRAVASGNVEDEYSEATGYTCDIGDTVVCDLPRFYLNREQKCNKVGDKALGSIDKGAYNLDEARSIFKTGAIEFQFILVKRGV